MPQQADDLQREEAKAQALAEESFSRFDLLNQQRKAIDECLSFSINHIPGAVADAIQYLSWLDHIEALAFDDINEAIRKERLREHLASPTTTEQQQLRTPQELMTIAKTLLEVKRAEIQGRQDVNWEWLHKATDRAYQTKVDRRSLQYGKESIELITMNIGISVGVPVAVLVLTLFGTIAFEALKPEILDWIRHLLRLSPLKM